jgi:rare lipoprotein A (peptidoglycan hydrolase)
MQQSNAGHSLAVRAGRANTPVLAGRHALGVAALALLLSTPASGWRNVGIEDTVSSWTQSGGVSWYGPGFHGRRTASGEIFDTNDLTMAHRSLRLGSKVRVTNLANGRSVVLRVNDRGPYVRGRIADLSRAAAQRLGFVDDGVVRARIELL